MTELGTRPFGRQIATAVAAMWTGGAGPSHSAIDSSLSVVGLDPDDFSGLTKQNKIREALAVTDDTTARHLVTELIDLLRTEGTFENGDDDSYRRMQRLRQALAPAGANLDPSGILTWANATTSPILPASTPPGDTGVSPGLGFLTEVLRRLPEASRPLAGRRRKGKASVNIADEYDVQDFVHQALRLLYADTRAEETMPSYAGGSARTDFFIKAESTVIEVKVTRTGRGERDISNEIIIDQRKYQAHPGAKHLIAAVYDLAGTFTNPAGFEDDLSQNSAGLLSTVLVVSWPNFG